MLVCANPGDQQECLSFCIRLPGEIRIVRKKKDVKLNVMMAWEEVAALKQ